MLHSWFLYSKYSSFQRQLNIYGFTRITDGVDKNCYFHEHFLRGQERLLYKIIRIPTKKDAPCPPRVLAQLPDLELIPVVSSSLPDSSTGEAYTRLPPAMLSRNIQLSHGNLPYSQTELDLERRIELLRRTNHQYISQAIQLEGATNSYHDTLLNNLPTNMTSKDALLLQMMQNGSSIPMASEFSLPLSPFQAPVAASLPHLHQFAPSEWLRRQISQASAASITSQLKAELRTKLALYLQQRPPLGQGGDVMLDPVLMRYLDPHLLSQLPPLAATNIQNQILEHQLNHDNDQSRQN